MDMTGCLEELLLDAVKNNNEEKISDLLVKGANINKLLPSGWSVLGQAVKHGEISAIQQLLLSGQNNASYQTCQLYANFTTDPVAILKCNVNITDHYERTPLHYAAEYGHPEILRLLLKAGSRIDVSDRENVTPLHLAVCRGHEDVVEHLLRVGTEVNRKTSDKSSALHLAASRGFSGIVKMLLKHGAKVDALDSSDRTPLLLAVSRANHEVVKLLIYHGAKVNTEEIHGYTPLAEAVWKKDATLVHILLEAGAKITKSLNLLHYCVMHRNFQLMELLLHFGCLVNVRDDSGDTPLHIAARTGESNIAELLIKHGANVNYPSGLLGTSPLHEAVEAIRDKDHPKFAAMMCLLMRNKCLLAPESFMPGDTPLFRAILLDKFQIAAALIRHGADVNRGHVSSCNIDNLCLAQRKGNFFIVKLLVFGGFNLHHTPWLETLPSELPHNYHPLVKEWLIHMKKNPMPLTDLCRKTIRTHLGKHVQSVVTTLLIPQSIRRYLLLEDIEDD